SGSDSDDPKKSKNLAIPEFPEITLSNATHIIKEHKIPSFHGDDDDENPIEWLHDLIKVSEANSWDRATALRQIPIALKDIAADCPKIKCGIGRRNEEYRKSTNTTFGTDHPNVGYQSRNNARRNEQNQPNQYNQRSPNQNQQQNDYQTNNNHNNQRTYLNLGQEPEDPIIIESSNESETEESNEEKSEIETEESEDDSIMTLVAT
ncbi:3478_t:CDS:2, partial [Ambispora gerdemannii]